VIIDRVSGWLEGARRVDSPNSDDRPPGTQLDLIVVHGISLPPGRFGAGWIDRLFLNELPAAADPYFATIADLKVSAHALVARDGELTWADRWQIAADAAVMGQKLAARAGIA